jgi:hypothetical protein
LVKKIHFVVKQFKKISNGMTAKFAFLQPAKMIKLNFSYNISTNAEPISKIIITVLRRVPKIVF